MARKSKRNTRPFIIILIILFICTIIINTLLFISKEKLIKELEEEKTNGHVHLVGEPTVNGGRSEKDIYINLQYSCGQVDGCGNTTPACE